jgi:hypothetical protein
MMPRFFFHVRDGDKLTRDVEGADFPHLEAAQDDAKTAARQMLAEQIDRDGVLNGKLLATVPFTDTIKLQ